MEWTGQGIASVMRAIAAWGGGQILGEPRLLNVWYNARAVRSPFLFVVC